MNDSGKIAYLLFRTRESTGSKVVFHHAQALRQLGYQITIYTLFGSPSSWYPKGITTKSIFYYFIARRQDILVATFWPTAYIAFFLPAKKKFYLVMGWEEEFYTHMLLRYFVRLTYSLPIQKMAVSEYLAKKIRKVASTSGKISVIRTYIPKDLFPKIKSKIKAQKEKKEINVLSVISWYNKSKGPDLLIRIIRQLKKSRQKYVFTLASLENNPYALEIDNFISQPTRKRLIELYQSADVLLATSRSEGFFIPGIEAMANGCPFISTDSGGVSEYAVDHKNALLVKNSQEIWQKDVIATLVRSKKLRKTIIQNGYTTAKRYRDYSLIDLGKDLIRIFTD